MNRALVPCLLFALPVAAATLPADARFTPGPINSLRLGSSLAVYSSPAPAGTLLVTHARRDLAVAAAAVKGANIAVPENERDLFEHPEAFWEKFEKARFHDYAQPSTKVPTAPLPVSRAVKDGDAWNVDGAKVAVLDTPGFTPGAVSYLIEWKGKRIAATGDLILGDGQLFDLYSLQDAVPAAKARGYHGYAARAGDLIASLRRIDAWKPDVIVPVRGALIENPHEAIGRLIARLQALLTSHYTTDALRWYWGDDNLRLRAGKALDGKMPDWMPMAEQAKLPAWVIPIGNSRLIVSTSGAAFLVDAGYSKIIPELEALRKAGRFKALEGLWITHYHDDHTDYAQAVADRFRCPVYFTGKMRDILEKPSAYRMPCLTTNPIRGEHAQRDGAHLDWHEFKLTFQYFPGQTLYHGGLGVERESGESLYFAGDSFTPSGMDDYCLLNRNFLSTPDGFLYCLNVLDKAKQGTWIINQHVEPMFRFTPRQMALMRSELPRRARILRELSPWPGVDYAVDESWARMYPYGSEVRTGEKISMELRVMNHSGKPETYNVLWHAPKGLRLVETHGTAKVPAGREGKVSAIFEAAAPGLHIITADVEFGGRALPEWTEALVRVR